MTIIFRAVTRFIRLLLFVRSLGRKNISVAELFEQQCEKNPNKACLVLEGREWTFKEVNDAIISQWRHSAYVAILSLIVHGQHNFIHEFQSRNLIFKINDFKNRIANVFYQHGFKHGDKVALLMENRPEFVATWLGLSKLGCVIPLINHNLKKQSLLHSITIANCNGLIFCESLRECKFLFYLLCNNYLWFFPAVEEIHDQLPSNLALYQFNDDINLPVFGESKDLQTLLSQTSRDPPPADKIKKPGHHDELLYIYTSGTTGLPKAAVITHSRYIYIAAAIHKVADFWDEDVFYSPLPLYHTACGCMAVGQMLIHGSTVIIRKKFSATAFFADCAKYNATVSIEARDGT